MLEAEDLCATNLNYSYVIDAFADGVSDGTAFTGNSNDASGNYPLGTHLISWAVEDGCGNITSCAYTFTVEDCKKPTPVCINGLASVVMNSTGMITLWASDFNAPETSGSFDNCTDQADLQFRLRKITPGQSELTTLNEVLNLGTSALFTCDDIGFSDVELYVIDEAGNWNYCTTYVSIQDNNLICTDVGGSFFNVAGTIENEYQEFIAGVSVQLSGPNNNGSEVTGANGAFLFENIFYSNNVTLTPEKNTNVLNGITTFDLVLISKHILSILPLDSPYKIIAADVNRSGAVTTLDQVKLRRLILGIDTELEENTSWRFVDKDFVFPDATNPFATIFPEIISYNGISYDALASDFIGIKIGDVNGSAIPNNLLGTQDRNFDGTQFFTIENIKMEAGESYEVAFKADDFTNILGYQFTLHFDPTFVEFVDLKTSPSGSLTENNFGFTFVDQGFLTVSWDNAHAMTLKDGSPVFSILLKAKKSGMLKDILEVNSNITPAESYNTASTLNVALAFNGDKYSTSSKDTFELYQNKPNPFHTSSKISFHLPETGFASLKIMDVSGQVLKVVEQEFVAGYHKVFVHHAELSARGVLYYQLRTKDHMATRKMILLE